MKYGARNQLEGKVVEVKRGGVMAQVKVEVAPHTTLCSVMTLESLDDLALAQGDTVRVLVKAVNVLLAK